MYQRQTKLLLIVLLAMTAIVYFATNAVAVDTTPPSINITNPTANAYLRQTVTIQVNASDDIGVTRVEYYLDGNLLNTVTTAPFSYNWDTTAATNAGHTLTANAYDQANNNSSSTVSITVDNQSPTITNFAPSNGFKFSNSVAAIFVGASDNNSVTKVDFYVDGGLIFSDTVSPFRYVPWDTTVYEDFSTHTVGAIAEDQAGNRSAMVTATGSVDNTPPVVAITNPLANAKIRGTVDVTVDASDKSGIAPYVCIGVTNAPFNYGIYPSPPYSYVVDTTQLSDGVWTISTLATNSYSLGTEASIDVTVDNTTPTECTVAVNGLNANGWTKNNPPSLTMTFTDPSPSSGFDRYDIFLNDPNGLNEPFASTTSETYTFPSVLYDGSQYNLWVRGYDGAGNHLDSNHVIFSIDRTAPYGSISINSSQQYITNPVVSLLLNAQDNSDGCGVYQMCFSNDGSFTNPIWEPYNIIKSYYNVPSGDGPKTVYVKFRDYVLNESQIFQTSVVLEQSPPTGIILNHNGIGCVYAHDGGSGVGMVRFRKNGGNWSPWQIYLSRDLEDYNLGNGGDPATIFAQFRDNANHTSNEIQSRNIQVDLHNKHLLNNQSPGSPIVFVSDSTGNSEIYIMNEDGSSQANLTNYPSAQDTSPCWSYNQDQIAFVSTRSGNKRIYLMDPDGSNQRTLPNMNPNSIGDDDSPVFSKDGTKIAFVANRDGHNEIYIYDLQTQTAWRVTDYICGESASNPSWQPDGMGLTYELTVNGISSIYEIYLPGLVAGSLFEGSTVYSYSTPAWSPDGFNLAVVKKSNNYQWLLVFNRGSSYTFTPASGTLIGHPSWDPDGAKITYFTNSSGSNEIYTVSALQNGATSSRIATQSSAPAWGGVASLLTGQIKTSITALSGGQYSDIVYMSNADRYSLLAFPSRDGSHPYFISSHPLLDPARICFEHVDPNTNIDQICMGTFSDQNNQNSIIPSTPALYQGSNQNIDFAAPVAALGGTRIVFSARNIYAINQGGIYLYNISNSQTVQLRQNSGQYTYPYDEFINPSFYWSQNNQSIYYIRDHRTSSTYHEGTVWRMNLDGTNNTQIGNATFMDDLSSAVISPNNTRLALGEKNYLFYTELSTISFQVVLTGDNLMYTPLAWSSDEKKILFEYNGSYYLNYYQSGYENKVKIDLFK